MPGLFLGGEQFLGVGGRLEIRLARQAPDHLGLGHLAFDHLVLGHLVLGHLVLAGRFRVDH